MTRSGGCVNVLVCALALVAAAFAPVGDIARADDSTHDAIVYLQPAANLNTILGAVPVADVGENAATWTDTPWTETLPQSTTPPGSPLRTQRDSADPDPADPDPADADADEFDAFDDSFVEYTSNDFTWQVGPSGIIYRSYLAGPHEPRISITPFFESNRALWDATIGGRGGVLRYGDRDPLHPQGWQLDVYGASIVRMDAENHQDLNSADFVFGFPLTYGVDNWQFKLGYAHLSSHLGDEYALRYPGTLDDRINYVRDGLVFGTSWYPFTWCRVYGEYDWAFHVSDGAGPNHFQFGNELSHAGPTGLHGSPFLALNGRMRQEHDYGGDLTVQTGWLWRGVTGKTFRLGGHYYNGKSSQSQFFNTFEEQVGMGLWYDF